jgi:hypothetical protein
MGYQKRQVEISLENLRRLQILPRLKSLNHPGENNLKKLKLVVAETLFKQDKALIEKAPLQKLTRESHYNKKSSLRNKLS